jgi:hypothetical protein
VTVVPTSSRLAVPELGPSLGRLVVPTPGHAGPAGPWMTVDDLRLGMVTQLFELAGDARRWSGEGERELALATLNREAWQGVWRNTVHTVAARTAAVLSRRLAAAAAEARIPARRARNLAVTNDEVEALAIRLDRGSGPLIRALYDLDHAAHAVRSAQAPAEQVQLWQDALGTAARRLEAAWIELEVQLGDEWRNWEREIGEIRRWRRPFWPVLLTAALLVLGLGYFGFVLGGYLPVPEVLRPLVERIWDAWS